MIAHEYFHNWTGNRVTCRDWFQLSLKEGLTVFRDQEFSSDQGSRAVERIAAVEYLRREQFAEDAGPMAHPVRPDEYQEINNFYTATVYEKGAELIRMQHALLGADRLSRRNGSLLRAPRRSGGHLRRVRAVDAGCVRRRSRAVPQLVCAGRNAGGHRARQLRRAGANVCAGRRAERAVRDRQPPPTSRFHIPLAIGLDRTRRPRHAAAPRRRAAGRARTTRCSSSREARSASSSSTSPPRQCRRCCADFRRRCESAYDYDDESLALLASHDSDAVNRWDAAQRLFTNAILRLADAHRGGAPLLLPPVLARVVRQILGDHASDPSLLALALAMPDAAYVAHVALQRFAVARVGLVDRHLRERAHIVER